jgi:hypothetical protein
MLWYYSQCTHEAGAGKTLLPVGGVADVEIEDMLDVVIV